MRVIWFLRQTPRSATWTVLVISIGGLWAWIVRVCMFRYVSLRRIVWIALPRNASNESNVRVCGGRGCVWARAWMVA